MTRARALVVLLAGAFVACVFAVAVEATPLPPQLRDSAAAGSVVVDDRGGRTLREVRAGDGTRARWVLLRDVPSTTTRALLAAEDARFFRHPGVDPLALLRAAVLDVWRRRIVSGGSTLTMQLARILRPHPRTLQGKLGEVLLALRIEQRLTKDEILEQYLNRASFGPNLRGIGAASDAYFDKSVSSLSTAESALLAGLPRGPSLYQVTRHPDRARRRRDRVLDRMAARGWLGADEVARAKEEPITTQSRRPAFGAPHFVAALASGALAHVQPGLREALSADSPSQPVARLTSTIDATLQRVAEAQVAATVEQLRAKGVSAASALVVENSTGDVLAYVGSHDMFDDANGGQNDGVRAERQPGSTLKPILYELAMEKLGFDPATRLPDIELHVSVQGGVDYAPRDYDGRFRGPVRLREALGGSLNVPAVWTVEQVGVDVLLERLHELGFDSLRSGAAYYGPGLALGDGEVTLLELARAYSTLARGGLDRPLRIVSRVERAGAREPMGFEPAPTRRVMQERFADLVVDVLKDHDARAGSFGEQSVLDFPFEVAAKTGTSKGYRDNWTVGFTRSVTVAVWAGNFDGAPMTNVSGITGAGPLFHAIMEAAMRGRRVEPLPMVREGSDIGLRRVEVCALSGEIAGPDCPHRIREWRPAEAPTSAETCAMHERVPIDRRNGLRAGPACARDEVEAHVFERFPPVFVRWAEVARRPLAPSAWSNLCPAGVAAVADPERLVPRIVYPLSGERFVIDPDRPRTAQRLGVQIVAPPWARAATLVVDGERVARFGPPFDVSWALREGEHDLVAEVDGVQSAAVRVAVRP